MSKFGRAVQGAEAGAIAAAGVALLFFVLDLMRLQPLATPGALSGAVYGPAGFEWDLSSVSGLLAGLSMAYQIATFTLLHFLAFALVGVLAALRFDWKHWGGFKPVLAVAALCTMAFTATVVISATVSGLGLVVAFGALRPVVVVGVNLLAALLLVGYLRLANMPDPEPDSGNVPDPGVSDPARG